MGKKYRKRKKQIRFGKIEFSRNAKMWLILGGSLLLLILLALVTKSDFLGNLAFGFIFTAPMLLSRHQFSKDEFWENQKISAIFIYAYVAVIWLYVIFPSVKIRWLLSFVYFIAGGIHLIYKARTISFKEDIDGDFILLGLAELCMCWMLVKSYTTTEMNILGWILTAIFTVILFLPIAYFFLRELSISLFKKIGSYIVILFFIFAFSQNITEGLNHSLDFSKPTAYQTTIITKNYSHSVRGGTSHSFYIYIDGELKNISVNADIYKKYEKGENVELHIHRGVLGMTYYTVDEIKRLKLKYNFSRFILFRSDQIFLF